MRRAFTLIEVLAVMAIIIVLAGMVLGGALIMRRSSQVTAARSLVGTVAAAITSYTLRSFEVWDDGAAQARVARAWDVNRDNILDGIVEPPVFWSQAPAVSAPGGPALREQLRYRGFVATTALPQLPGIRKSDLVLVDPWKRPVHIAWVAQIYGDEGFCVWSEGRDPDDPSDDIRSREPR